MPPETVAILAIEVAGAHPVLDESLGARLWPLPVTSGRAVSANPRLPTSFVGTVSFMVDQTRFVPTQQSATAAVAHAAVVIRHEHVQHLGRAMRPESARRTFLANLFPTGPVALRLPKHTDADLKCSVRCRGGDVPAAFDK